MLLNMRDLMLDGVTVPIASGTVSTKKPRTDDARRLVLLAVGDPTGVALPAGRNYTVTLRVAPAESGPYVAVDTVSVTTIAPRPVPIGFENLVGWADVVVTEAGANTFPGRVWLARVMKS